MDNNIEIRGFPIELFKVLQIAQWVGSGGQAKAVIGEGMVTLNGAVELQKRKKCKAGDVVQFNQQCVVLVDES